MRVFYGFEDLPTFSNSVVTIGSFDGVHRGHLSLLEVLSKEAQRCDGESVVVTFDPHPRVVLGLSDGLRLLTSLEEKCQIFKELDIDNVIVIPFDRGFSRYSYEDFIRRYLVEKIGVRRLVMGYNHHLGRDNEGSLTNITDLGEECGFEVLRVEAWQTSEFRNVSSTVVRSLISGGDMERARELLSREYLLIGRSDDDGRVWFSDSLKLIPPKGEYRARVNGEEGDITVDENGVVYVSRTNRDVVIEIVKAIEV